MRGPPCPGWAEEASPATCVSGPHAVAGSRVWKPVCLLLRGVGPLRSPAVPPLPVTPEGASRSISSAAALGAGPLGRRRAGPRFLAAPHIRGSQTLAREGRWFIVGAKAWRSPERVQLRGAAAEGCGRLVLCVLCWGPLVCVSLGARPGVFLGSRSPTPGGCRGGGRGSGRWLGQCSAGGPGSS